MRLGWAARVALGTMLPILLGMGAFVLITLDSVQDTTRERYLDELRREVGVLGKTMPRDVDLAPIATALGARITVVDASGRVHADSEADPNTMENHGTRPEIETAWKGGVGVEQRHSRTVGRTLLYAATMLPDGDLVVRIARDVSAIDGEIDDYNRRFWLVAAGLTILACSSRSHSPGPSPALSASCATRRTPGPGASAPGPRPRVTATWRSSATPSTT